jgi:inosine-uridine nucleoside N-ribohydrolase
MQEFNIATDPEAASILFSLTSTTSETHPSAPRLTRPLRLTLVPLDATHLHGLSETFYNNIAEPAIKAGSPLSLFLNAILQRTYRKVESLVARGRESEVIELHMHDPLCIYYAMLDDEARNEWVIERNADVRVECTGTWTRGMTLLDQRERGKRPFEKTLEVSRDEGTEGEDTADGDYQGVDDDEGGWRGVIGNRIDIVWASSAAEGGNSKTVEAMAKLIWDLKG